MDRRTWRGVWVLVVATLMAGTLAIAPATAGKFLTKRKALKLFYTKAKADARFVDATELDGPVAYAHIATNGTLDGANSRNVSASSSPTSSSLYCIDVAPGITFKNVQVTPSNGLPRIVTVVLGDAFDACAPDPGQVPADVTVRVHDHAGAFVPSPFWIVFT